MMALRVFAFVLLALAAAVDAGRHGPANDGGIMAAPATVSRRALQGLSNCRGDRIDSVFFHVRLLF
ncbi:hypothetical protein BSKO_14126 [Bryopsis sp. KO-2023]|nr:hypothetical protein BSKO_14126 [Bryopsis sp. KO-2023]